MRVLGNAYVAAAVRQLRRTPLPPLLRSGVRYRRERRGAEDWLLPADVHRLGYGDCEDLAVWLAAELQRKGVKARFDVKRTGPKKWHAIVRLPSGRVLDPSAYLGMTKRRRLWAA